MNIWAIVLFVLEGLTLLGVPVALAQGKKGPAKVTAGATVVVLILTVVAAISVIMLGRESTYEHRELVTWIYLAVLIFGIFQSVLIMNKGTISYGLGRALWGVCSVIIGVTIISPSGFRLTRTTASMATPYLGLERPLFTSICLSYSLHRCVSMLMSPKGRKRTNQ